LNYVRFSNDLLAILMILDYVVLKRDENIFFVYQYVSSSSSSSSSSSYGHEVRSISDLFRPHDCIHTVVSLTVGQVVFRWVNSQRVILYI
jgi:hypothetical protein